ncbi:thioesterase-like superfamily-domain-containing protein [Lipomyces japonicus]|uniref:thioesterase-like superfamily-domain-containing protein n=1 Tax=Lipomyces japonicus TaxID=56871 RepID=UPI0034CD046D
MSSVPAPIERVLELRPVSLDFFRSDPDQLYQPPGARGVFGGTVVAQALTAAWRTVDGDSFAPHSMHCYFILAGDASLAIDYSVVRVRDGRSFVTRTVQACQRGKCIFTTTVSFQVVGASSGNGNGNDSDGVKHQMPYPGANLPQPDEVKDYVDQVADLHARGAISRYELANAANLRLLPTQSRPVASTSSTSSSSSSSSIKNQVWVRAKGKIADPRAHATALAYLSDVALLGTAARVNQVPADNVAMMVSLDHVIYFHQPSFRADDWLLYVMHSPWSGSDRALVYGSLYSASTGVLVASVVQEGVLRLKSRL